eukprot:GEMP01000353.1.p1 GENE.GEMP01000353.1~~GEMP01000353.1.p1  ORF type:complete len:2408 (+),score=647.55 GEMP01000353.1:86-7309(+)
MLEFDKMLARRDGDQESSDLQATLATTHRRYVELIEKLELKHGDVSDSRAPRVGAFIPRFDLKDLSVLQEQRQELIKHIALQNGEEPPCATYSNDVLEQIENAAVVENDLDTLQHYLYDLFVRRQDALQRQLELLIGRRRLCKPEVNAEALPAVVDAVARIQKQLEMGERRLSRLYQKGAKIDKTTVTPVSTYGKSLFQLCHDSPATLSCVFKADIVLALRLKTASNEQWISRFMRQMANLELTHAAEIIRTMHEVQLTLRETAYPQKAPQKLVNFPAMEETLTGLSGIFGITISITADGGHAFAHEVSSSFTGIFNEQENSRPWLFQVVPSRVVECTPRMRECVKHQAVLLGLSGMPHRAKGMKEGEKSVNTASAVRDSVEFDQVEDSILKTEFDALELSEAKDAIRILKGKSAAVSDQNNQGHLIRSFYQLRYLKNRAHLHDLMKYHNVCHYILQRLDPIDDLPLPCEVAPTMDNNTAPSHRDVLIETRDVPMYLPKDSMDVPAVYWRYLLDIVDGSERPVAYEGAIEDFRHTIRQLVRIGTFFLRRSKDVERGALMSDLLDCEVRFVTAKLHLLEKYMEIYEHVVDVKEASELRQQIVDTIYKRPCLDTTALYFETCYMLEISILNTKSTMLGTLIDVQRAHEHRVRHVHAKRIQHCRAGDSATNIVNTDAQLDLTAQLAFPYEGYLETGEGPSIMLTPRGVQTLSTEFLPSLGLCWKLELLVDGAFYKMQRLLQTTVPELAMLERSVYICAEREFDKLMRSNAGPNVAVGMTSDAIDPPTECKEPREPTGLREDDVDRATSPTPVTANPDPPEAIPKVAPAEQQKERTTGQAPGSRAQQGQMPVDGAGCLPQNMAGCIFGDNDSWLTYVCDEILTQLENPDLHAQLPTRDLLEFKKMPRVEMTLIIYSNMLQITRTYKWLQEEMLARSMMEACLHAQYTLCDVTSATHKSQPHAVSTHVLSSPYFVLATELFGEAEVSQFRDKLGVYLANTRQHDLPIFYQYELSRRWMAQACVMHNLHLMVPFLQARVEDACAAHGVSGDVIRTLSHMDTPWPSRKLYHLPIERREEQPNVDAAGGGGDGQFFAHSNLLVHVGARPQVLGDLYRSFLEKEQVRLRKAMARKGMTETLKKTRALQVQAVSYVALIMTQYTIDVLMRVQCCDVVNECHIQLHILAECAVHTPFIAKNPGGGVSVNLKTFPTIRELCQLPPAFVLLTPDEAMASLNAQYTTVSARASFKRIRYKASRSATDPTSPKPDPLSNVVRLSPLLMPSTGTTMLYTLQYMSSLLGFMFFLAALEGDRQSVLKLRLRGSGNSLTQLLSIYDPTLEAIQNFQQDFLRLSNTEQPPRERKSRGGGSGNTTEGGANTEQPPRERKSRGGGSRNTTTEGGAIEMNGDYVADGNHHEPMALNDACAFLAEKHRVVTAKVALVLHNLAYRCAKQDRSGAVRDVLQWLRFQESAACPDKFVHHGAIVVGVNAAPGTSPGPPYGSPTSRHRGNHTMVDGQDDESRWPLFDSLLALAQIELPRGQGGRTRIDRIRLNACSSNSHGGLRGCSFAYALCEIENELRRLALMLAVEADMHNAAPTGHHTATLTMAKRTNHVHTFLLHARLKSAALLAKLQIPPPRTASELATFERLWLSMTHDLDDRLNGTKVAAHSKLIPSPPSPECLDPSLTSASSEWMDHRMMEVAAVHRVVEECTVAAVALDDILILHTIDLLNTDIAALADINATYFASAVQRESVRGRKNVTVQRTQSAVFTMGIEAPMADTYAAKQELVLNFVNRLRQRATVVRTDMVGRAYILRECDLDDCATQLGEGLLYWGAQMSAGRRNVEKKMADDLLRDNNELRRLVHETKQTMATTDDNRNAKVNAMVSERALALMFENDDLKRKLQDLAAASSEVEFRLQCQWKTKMADELADLRRELQLREGSFQDYKEDLGNAVHDELRQIRLAIAERLKCIGETALSTSGPFQPTVTSSIPETTRMPRKTTKAFAKDTTRTSKQAHPLVSAETAGVTRDSLSSPRAQTRTASGADGSVLVGTKGANNVNLATEGTLATTNGGNFMAEKARELEGMTVEALQEEVLSHKKARIANRTILNLKIQTMQEKYERQIKDQALTLGSNGELWARLSEACAQERNTQEDLVKASQLVQLQGATVDTLTAQVEQTQEQRQRLMNWKRSTGARLEKLEDLVAKSKNDSDVNINTFLLAKKDALIRHLHRELAKTTAVDSSVEATAAGLPVNQTTSGRVKTTVAALEKEVARLKHELKSERSMKLRAFEKLRLMQNCARGARPGSNNDFSSNLEASMKDDLVSEEEEDGKSVGQFTVLDSWRKKPAGTMGNSVGGAKAPVLTSALGQRTPRSYHSAAVGPKVELGRQLKTAGLVISARDSIFQNEKLKFPRSAR